jgi:DoxX-like protein
VKVSGITGGLLPPAIIAYLVAAICLFGGLCILFGFMTRWAALVLIVFTILTLFLAHNFCTMEGPARIGNMVNFYKESRHHRGDADAVEFRCWPLFSRRQDGQALNPGLCRRPQPARLIHTLLSWTAAPP